MKKVLKWFGFGVLALILIGVGGALAGGSKSSEKVGEQNNSQPSVLGASSQNNSSGPELADSYKIGDIVKVGDYQFSLNKFEDSVSSGNQFITPKAGNKFIRVTLTIENMGKDKSNISTLIQMYLKDGEGNKYQQTFLPDQKQIDGELLAGDKIKGELVYEVPKAVTGLKFYYNAAWLTGKSIVINLS